MSWKPLLAQRAKLAECSGRMVWPGRGVYFFARRTSTAATQAKARESSASGRTLHKIERVRNQSALIDKLGKRIHSRNTCRPDQMSDQGAVRHRVRVVPDHDCIRAVARGLGDRVAIGRFGAGKLDEGSNAGSISRNSAIRLP